MSLKYKSILVFSLIIVLNMILHYGVHFFILSPSFHVLERNESIKDMERCQAAIKRVINYLSLTDIEWSSWSETAEFVSGNLDEYIGKYLKDESFANDKVNLLYIVNIKNEVQYGRIYDYVNYEEIFLKDFPRNRLPSGNPFQFHQSYQSVTSGVFLTEKYPLLVVSCPIFNSEITGSISGYMILGVFVNDIFVKKIEDQILTPIKIRPVNNDSIPANERYVLDQITKENPYYFHEQSNEILWVYTTYPDLEGNPALLLRATIPRHVANIGYAALDSALISVLLLGLLILLVMISSLQAYIVGPIIKLTRYVSSIYESGNLTNRISIKRGDEIGVLANKFDQMIGRLEETQGQLQEKSDYFKQISTIDGLTQIFNRRYFDEHYNEEWRRAIRNSISLSLAMCDIDFFKKYNDSYGHQEGDKCLRIVAHALNEKLKRPGDLVARYGGEEFVILMVGTTPENALAIVDSMREKIETLALEHIKSECSNVVTLSIGLAGIIPNRDIQPEELIQAADRALYIAKNEGRNQVKLAENFPQE